MVGVPRSSGCRICVQRRVKCDGARPTCNNCRKGNRPCPGYGPGVKFQDEGPKLREKFHKAKKQSTHQGNDDDLSSCSLTPNSDSTEVVISAPTTPKDWNILGVDIEGSTFKSRINIFEFVEGKTNEYLNIDMFDFLYGSPSFKDQNGTLFETPSDLTSMLITPVMSPQAQQDQLLAEFTHSIIPPESRFLPKPMQGQRNWLAHIPNFTGASLLLDSAVRAVTLVHIGRLHKSDIFIMESRPYYGKALRLLNTAISDKEMGMDNKTLCATILLSFYEMFASDEDASWIRHAGGAGTLMRIRGAKRHRYGFDRDIFLSYRHTLVIEAMTLDIPSFLDEPEWREVTRQIYSDLLDTNQIPAERVLVFDVVEDFFSQMAAISTSSAHACYLNNKIEQGTVTEDDDLSSVYNKLREHRDALTILIKKWKIIMGKIGHQPPLKPVDDPAMPYQYQYSNVFIASFYVGFWTTMMLCNSNLYPLATALGHDTQALIAENEEFAEESCRSVEFMLKSSFLGPFFTIYALRFAFRIFEPGDIRSDWALCKLIEIGDRRMKFAKSAIGGGPHGMWEKPEVYVESARQRLTEYYASFRQPGHSMQSVIQT